MAKRKTTEAAAETKAAATDKVTTESTATPDITAAEAVAAPIEATAIDVPKIEAAAEPAKIEIPASDAKPSAAIEPPKADHVPEHILPIAAQAEAPRRTHRFALLAASVAMAAALGGIAGAAATVGFSRSDEPANAAAAETRALKQTVAKLGSELATLKAGFATAGRNSTTQFNRIAERLDRAEKAQAEPAAKLARIAETLDRLERRQAPAAAAAPVAPPYAPAHVPAPATDITGSVTALDKSQARPPVIEGWKLHDFYAGRAVLENRNNGNLYDIGPGSILPGVGKVEQIKREENQVIVVTPRGIITAALAPSPRRSPYYVPYR